MRWSRVVAVVGRDLRVALGSKAIVLPAVLVPLLLLVALPAAIGLAPRYLDADALGDAEQLLVLLPGEVLATLPEDPALLGAVVTLTYLLTPLILLVPVMLSTVLAADGIAGEQERGTLEGLLLTPLSDRELAGAKLLAAWVPAVVIGLLGAALYATVTNLTLGRQLGEWLLPTAEFVVLAVWTGPTFGAAALGAVSLVSVRSRTTQDAFQLGGFVVLPVVAMVVGQAAGLLLLSVWALVGAGLLAALAAGLLLVAATRSLSRPRLGPRLR